MSLTFGLGVTSLISCQKSTLGRNSDMTHFIFLLYQLAEPLIGRIRYNIIIMVLTHEKQDYQQT